jgi:hypothetical protein
MGAYETTNADWSPRNSIKDEDPINENLSPSSFPMVPYSPDEKK